MSQKTTKLVFVGNLPYDATEDDVRQHFAKIGPINSITFKYNQKGQPKGCCILEFNDAETANKALSMHETRIGMRYIHVAPGLSSSQVRNQIEEKKLRKKMLKYRDETDSSSDDSDSDRKHKHHHHHHHHHHHRHHGSDYSPSRSSHRHHHHHHHHHHHKRDKSSKYSQYENSNSESKSGSDSESTSSSSSH